MSTPSEAERLWREAHVACSNCQGAYLPYPAGDHLGNPWHCVALHKFINAAVRAAFEEATNRCVVIADEYGHASRFSDRGHEGTLREAFMVRPLPPWLPAANEDK